MTASERKFLFVIVRESLRRFSDEVEQKHLSNKHIPPLRSLGYVKGNKLAEDAFREFFGGFESISGPIEIKQLSENFKIDVQWRRPYGFIKDQFDGTGSGKAFPALGTVFIKGDATLETWYHEFGHVLYWRIKTNSDLLQISKRLLEIALREYPVVTHAQMMPVLHPKTREEVLPASGRYVLINRQYLGLDHSGDGSEGEADELWAVLFTEYQMSRPLHRNVRAVVEELIFALGDSGPMSPRSDASRS